MKKKTRTQPRLTHVYQLKITLRHVKPPVWRRILMPSNVTLDYVHAALNFFMGWTDSHLHGFRVGDARYGEPDPYFPGTVQDERKVHLDKIAHEGDTFIYDYDFGDNWEHDVLVEKILDAEPGATYPRCLAGKRACPPEDCGGPHGYMHMLNIIKNTEHEEYEDIVEWLGDAFDPEQFSVDEANAVLRG